MKLKILVCIPFIFASFCSYAQTKSLKINNEIQSFKVGDIIPDVEIKNIINYSKNSVRISDFEGKLIILDFWATWCSPCVASFPRLDSMQNKFADILQIIPVTYEKTTLVTSFLEKYKKVSGVKHFSATSDEILNRYFKHTSVPHYVWIDATSRKILAYTEGKDVNESNIIAFKTKQPIQFSLKYEENKIIDFDRSLFLPAFNYVNQDDNTKELIQMPENSMLFHSVISKYVDGLPSTISFFDPEFVSINNIPVWRLYQLALFGNSNSIMNNGYLQTDIPDTTIYNHVMGRGPGGKALTSGLESLVWIKENGYCYELKVPPALIDKKYDIMLDEINKYFGALYGIEGVIEKRNIKMLALTRTGSDNKLTSKGGTPKITVDPFSIKVKNESLDAVLTLLSKDLQLYPPTINETMLDGNVDMELNCQLSDLSALNQELEKYGLKFVEKEHLRDIAVIRMKKK